MQNKFFQVIADPKMCFFVLRQTKTELTVEWYQRTSGGRWVSTGIRQEINLDKTFNDKYKELNI